MATETNPPLLELRDVCMAFPKPSGELLPVLEKIDVSLRDGEILGLLGRSGSGKSTLLRIAAGLIRPTSGEVIYRGAPLAGPSEGIAVVFQTFALYPWLTVMENVETGLDALALSREEAHRRALAAIDRIGLEGCEAAYPRELSGGMRQRVGFARALVADPVVLLMDEPFSALDVLTAETLRTDFLDLWIEHQLPTRSVLIVTHNLEEAVLMCDRILVLAANPGHLTAEIPVTLAQPRDRLDPELHDVVEEIYSLLTARVAASPGVHSDVHGGLLRPLPEVSPRQIATVVEKLAQAPFSGQAKLTQFAAALGLRADDLFPIAVALHTLAFAELHEGGIRLTAAGQLLAQGEAAERKRLFREHLLHFVPLAAHIGRVLAEREGHKAPRLRFETELEDHLNRHDAEQTLRTVTAWGRYAELFGYDDKRRTFSALATV